MDRLGLKVHRNRIQNYLDVATKCAIEGETDEAVELLQCAIGEIELMVAKLEGSWPSTPSGRLVLTESGEHVDEG